MRQVLLRAGLDFVDDGEKYGDGVRVVVDFGGGEKFWESGECGGEVEGALHGRRRL